MSQAVLTAGASSGLDRAAAKVPAQTKTRVSAQGTAHER